MKKLDFTSAAVTFTEWFSGIAILNLSWLLFSLPLVTLIPATDAVFAVVQHWKEKGKPESVFRLFKLFFRKNFKQSFKLGIPVWLVILLVLVDIYFLNSQTLTAAWFQIFKYAFYTLALLIGLTLLYVYPLSKTLNTTFLKIFMLSFFQVVGHPKTTLAVLAGLVIFGFLFLWFPAMFFFMPVSGAAWLGITAVEVNREDWSTKEK